MVVVDSQFPLENYHRMFATEVGELERRAAQTAFRNDVKKHVDAIAGKYIPPEVTSDGAVMFLPAEAVFAELHAYHPEVVAYAMSQRVWIVSPTAMAVPIPPARCSRTWRPANRSTSSGRPGQAHKDFNRFDERMQEACHPIRQAGGTWPGADFVAQDQRPFPAHRGGMRSTICRCAADKCFS